MKLKSKLKLSPKVKGFTLIEMVVVIAIIAMLILLIAPNLAHQRDNAESKTDTAFKTTLQTQYELAKEEDCQTFSEMYAKDFLTDHQLKKAEAKYVIKNDRVVEKNATP